MSNFVKEISKSNLAISALCISLFFVQIIVEIVLRSVGYEEGQISWAWGIGGSLLIIGIANLGYNYYKYKTGGYNNTVQAETTTIDLSISDKTQHSYVGIRIISFLAFIDSLVGGIFMFARPYFGAYFGSGVYGYIGAGYGDQGLGVAAAVFMILSGLLALIIIAIPSRLKSKYILSIHINFTTTFSSILGKAPDFPLGHKNSMAH